MSSDVDAPAGKAAAGSRQPTLSNLQHVPSGVYCRPEPAFNQHYVLTPKGRPSVILGTAIRADVNRDQKTQMRNANAELTFVYSLRLCLCPTMPKPTAVATNGQMEAADLSALTSRLPNSHFQIGQNAIGDLQHRSPRPVATQRHTACKVQVVWCLSSTAT